jgi:hypothetical protein
MNVDFTVLLPPLALLTVMPNAVIAGMRELR